ncbi:hypothetical protein LLOABG_LLOABG_08975, partial [Dysosmobacter welbionis]
PGHHAGVVQVGGDQLAPVRIPGDDGVAARLSGGQIHMEHFGCFRHGSHSPHHIIIGVKSGWRPFPASSAVRFRLDLLPEHQKKTDGQQQTAGPDGPCSPELGGNAAESGPQGKNEDDGE